MDLNASPREGGNQRCVGICGLEPLAIGFVSQNQWCGLPVNDDFNVARFGGHAARREQIEIARDSVETAVDPFWPACLRSEEHTSELQSLMRLSYAVFFLIT